MPRRAAAPRMRAALGDREEVLDRPRVHVERYPRLSVMFRFGLDRAPGLLSRSPPHANAAAGRAALDQGARRCSSCDVGSVLGGLLAGAATAALARALRAQGRRRNDRSRAGPGRGHGDPLHQPRHQDPRFDHRVLHREARDQGRVLPRRLGRRHLQGAGRGRCRAAAGRHGRRLRRGRAAADEGARHPEALPLARRRRPCPPSCAIPTMPGWPTA